MNRVLIVRLGALGDIVHAIPVAAALRRAYPSVRIDWLVSAKHREILDLVPVIDRRLVVKDRPASLLGAIRELRRNRYDVALDLKGSSSRPSSRAAPAPAASSASRRAI